MANNKDKPMTVQGLIDRLQSFPLDSAVLLSKDEEGNAFKTLCHLTAETYIPEKPFRQGPQEVIGIEEGFQTGKISYAESCVIIWPYG